MLESTFLGKATAGRFAALAEINPLESGNGLDDQVVDTRILNVVSCSGCEERGVKPSRGQFEGDFLFDLRPCAVLQRLVRVLYEIKLQQQPVK